MAGSGNDGSKKRATGNDVQEEVNLYEDEINLLDYFRVIWKRKWFIFLASVLPALAVGLATFSAAKDYKINYTYNMELDEKTFKILDDTFYSTENLEKFIEKLQANGFNGYAERLAGTETVEGLRAFVSFEISPSYFEAIEPSKAKNLDDLEKFRQARGSLLVMRVGAKSGENIRKISVVCRNNFEQVIPLYSVREELNNTIIDLKEEMAGIEETKYLLDINLQRKQAALEKFKAADSKDLSGLSNNIILQFNIEPAKAEAQNDFQNVGNNSAYLPLPYQVQATETQIINLEERIRTDKEKYDYYTGLLDLNGKLLSNVKEAMPSHFTLEQFHAFLIDTLAKYKENDRQCLDYLKAYIKRIENKIANTIPLVEKPKVYLVAKGTSKKSAIVFVLALMISIFAAFLSEGLKKSQSQAS